MQKNYFNIVVPGVCLYEEENVLILSSEKKLLTLNSSVLGGGFQTPHHVINLQVDKGYSGTDPVEDIKTVGRKMGLSTDESVGMMTAALVKHVAVVNEEDEEVSVTAVVTAGVSNAMAAGGTPPPFTPYRVGTINIIVLIDGNLTEGGMVNAVIMATEAKTMALQDFQVRDVFSGEAASGTSTDAVVVAVTGKGEKLSYAGAATQIGGMIGRTVRKGVGEALRRYFRYKEEHPD